MDRRHPVPRYTSNEGTRAACPAAPDSEADRETPTMRSTKPLFGVAFLSPRGGPKRLMHSLPIVRYNAALLPWKRRHQVLLGPPY
jgi:hypothetical protein